MNGGSAASSRAAPKEPHRLEQISIFHSPSLWLLNGHRQSLVSLSGQPQWAGNAASLKWRKGSYLAGETPVQWINKEQRSKGDNWKICDPKAQPFGGICQSLCLGARFEIWPTLMAKFQSSTHSLSFLFQVQGSGTNKEPPIGLDCAAIWLQSVPSSTCLWCLWAAVWPALKNSFLLLLLHWQRRPMAAPKYDHLHPFRPIIFGPFASQKD